MALNLPTGPRGQMLALGVTLIGAALLWLGAIAPLLDWYGEREEALRQKAAAARRMAGLVELLPQLRDRAPKPNGGDADPASFLGGATDAIAAAALQQRIDELAATAGVHIGSEEILPGQADGAFRAIAVRLSVNAPYPALVDWLTALAGSNLPMVTDDLQLRAQVLGRNPMERGQPDAPVDASLTVTSWRVAKGDAPKEEPRQ